MRTRMVNPAIVIAGLLGGAATASGIALTATSGWLIVRASEGPVILTLLTAIVGVRAFGMARPYFRYVERVRSHDAALDELATRRTRTYAALVPLTPARLGRHSRSTVLTGVVDDLTDVVEAQVRVTVPVLSALVAGLLAVLLTALLHPPIGLVLAGLLVLLAVACWLAWRLELRSQDELLAARAEVMRVSDLATRQADDLRSVGAVSTALDWIEDAHDRWARAVRRQSHGRALAAALILVGTGLATLASAYLARSSGHGGPIAALLVVVPVAVGDGLAPLAEAMRALARAQGSQERLDAMLDQSPAVADRAAADAEPRELAGPAPHLRLTGVSASWTGEGLQLPPTDLDLPPGRRVALVGANGSGKSTLLAVLARHLDPAGGLYEIDGHDVRDLPLRDVRALIAVVEDEPHVFASTLRANLLVAAPDASDEQLTAALGRAGLGRWFADLPEGMDTRLGTGGRGLSGGERARLGIARAVASQRPVILLDEPVAHLDHATAVAVLDDLVAATESRTVVIVSHRPEGLDGLDAVVDLTPTALHGRLTIPKEN
jgi:ATP-binding cassette subfamily C protein CydC